MKNAAVSIIGPSTLFREGLQALLRRSHFTVVSSTAMNEEVIAEVQNLRPDLVICAVSDEDDASAIIEQIREAEACASGLKFVLITDLLGADTLREAAAAGIRAVLSKDISSQVLQRSLELVLLGQQLFPCVPENSPPRPPHSSISIDRPALASTAVQEASYLPDTRRGREILVPESSSMGLQRSTTLSDRERQILRCLVEGAANKTIARDLTITEATVKVHIKGLLRKIRVNNRTQAAVWGLNNISLFEPTPTPRIDHDFPASRQANA